MAELHFMDEDIAVGPAPSAPVLVRTAIPLADRPALLIHLGGDRRSVMGTFPHRLVPDAFVAAGHRVVSFDLPNHGDLIDRFGEGLPGMVAAIRAGEDVFARIAAIGRAVVDLALARGWASPDRLAVCGISRGALAAMHVMAADRRVRAGAFLAPVTHIPAVSEFAALADRPIIERANAVALVARLADRPIYLSIGRADERVSTARCVEFHEALRRRSTLHPPVLATWPTEGHSLPDQGYADGAAFLLEALA